MTVPEVYSSTMVSLQTWTWFVQFCVLVYSLVLFSANKGENGLHVLQKKMGKYPFTQHLCARINHFPFPWLIYSEKVKTIDIYIRDSTNITDYAVLLFGGSLIPDKKGDGMEMLGGYLQFSATKKVAQLVQELRRELDGLLQRKIEQLQMDIHDQGKGVVNSVLELLQSNVVQRLSREEYTSRGGYRR
ncbi:hypothetical protein L7F22_037781 [Adiantum nelumboides]|nr:hypothetical protein [Adiantum nelumboides]